MKILLSCCLLLLSLFLKNNLAAQALAFDNCGGAVSLIPGKPGNDSCKVAANYDVSGATQSIPFASCDAIASATCRDVWFTFKASATSHIIKVDGSTSFIPVIEAFTGSCGTLTSIGCISAISQGSVVELQLTGLTTNQDYFFRVYHRNSSIPATTTFTVCLQTAPANDECSGAIIINPKMPGDNNCSNAQSFDANLASQSLKYASCDAIATANSRDVWFSFTAMATSHTIVVDGSSSFHAIVEAFSGNCGSLSSIGCISASISGAIASLQLTGLTPGKNYSFRVYHRNATVPSTTTFTVCLQTAPLNDECSGAISITPNAPGNKNCTPSTFDAVLASQTRPYASCDAVLASTARDVWFSFKASASSHTIEAKGSSFYFAIVEAFKGSCSGLIPVGCGTASSNGSNVTLQLSGLKPDSIYYFRVYHRSSGIPSTTTFTLCIFTAVSNDECDNATLLTPNAPLDTCKQKSTYFTDFSSQSRTYADCDPSYTSFARDVWFKITATASSHTIIVDGSSSYYALVEGYSGSCASLTSIGCAAASSTGGIATLVLAGLNPGKTYFIRVYHRSSQIPTTPGFSICVRTPPQNDDCENAILLKPNNAGTKVCLETQKGDGSLATQTNSYASCDNSFTSNARDVWFKFIASATSHTIIADGSTSYFPIVEAFMGNCASLSSIGCAISSATGGSAKLFLTGLTEGNMYYVRVYHRSSNIPSTTDFSICLLSAPVNDETCAARELIPGFTCNYDTADAGLASQTRTYATCDANMPSVARDVWFKFKASSSVQNLTVDGSSSYFAILEAFSGNCAALNSIGCASSTATGGIATLKLSGLTSGNTYFARVYHRTSAEPSTTTFAICITDPLITSMNHPENGTIRIYPNPASDELFIYSKNFKATEMEIIHTTGKKITTSSLDPIGDSLHKLNISVLPAGIYFICFKTENQKQTFKFIKQ